MAIIKLVYAWIKSHWQPVTIICSAILIYMFISSMIDRIETHRVITESQKLGGQTEVIKTKNVYAGDELKTCGIIFKLWFIKLKLGI